MKTFKYWLNENFGDDHDFSSLKPHHSYTTKDGHKIDVHLFNNPNGSHAIFYNKNFVREDIDTIVNRMGADCYLYSVS